MPLYYGQIAMSFDFSSAEKIKKKFFRNKNELRCPRVFGR